MKKLYALLMMSLCLTPKILEAKIYAVGLDKDLYTSDFMMGSVIVSVIFPESNGALDPNRETWSDARKTQVLSKIMTGLDWWTKQNPKAPLSFTFVSQTVATKYEPITRPYYDESLWIPDVMGKIGYTGDRFTATHNYVNALRAQYKTDWGYVIFVVDSANDSNGKFADGLFAYSYLGGPFTVMTYDNNGYGISNMDVVIAHETGHIFNALDEYAGASSPQSYSYGYFSTINGNHVYSPTANDSSSIMRGGITWGLDKWAREMVGWKDSNNNGTDDIVDVPPTTTLAPQSGSSAAGDHDFAGQAAIKVAPRQNNSSGYGFTVDTISRVEYRLSDNSWSTAIPADGSFDSAQEAFEITIPASQLSGTQALNTQDVDVRVITAFATYGGSAGSLGAPLSLSSAHAYPNPFKPNSSLGHTSITFAGLTPGAKVQIFSPSGEPVFDATAAGATTSLSWTEARGAASGVYYYLITDDAGNKKKGKLAVIR